MDKLDKVSHKISIGISPCPNDTFIFHSWIHRDDYLNVVYADVQELNKSVLAANYDVCKVSYGVLGEILDEYVLLRSGSALGHGVGPLLIAKPGFNQADINSQGADLKVAIPGKNTTANLLLGLAFPQLAQKIEYSFEEIEEVVQNGIADLGLIIHESRFTYQEKGLIQIIDLGDFWEKKFQLPIPLGGIVARRSLGKERILEIEQEIRTSLEQAFADPEKSRDFIQQHAQEMDPKVQKQHIDLYVNEFSLNLGKKAEKAIQELLLQAGYNFKLPEIFLD
jgi:1,4-dihydroxy-6-naphthoate synthase